jgi:hypothetical protein
MPTLYTGSNVAKGQEISKMVASQSLKRLLCGRAAAATLLNLMAGHISDHFHSLYDDHDSMLSQKEFI